MQVDLARMLEEYEQTDSALLAALRTVVNNEDWHEALEELDRGLDRGKRLLGWEARFYHGLAMELLEGLARRVDDERDQENQRTVDEVEKALWAARCENGRAFLARVIDEAHFVIGKDNSPP